jgi:class 3 adenylate cyclase/tetratricopeptide (TPR) repeat protein
MNVAPSLAGGEDGEVRCPSCGRDNPAQAKFCMACGVGLERPCPSCGAAAPAGARFCIDCGAQLTDDAAPVERPPDAPAPDLPEERRRVTVLFADLVGYTAMAERMDPEHVSVVSDRVLRRLAEEVHRHGGVIDKYIGDNVMALFGAPVAHEDDPERAVRAGLAMQAAMSELNSELGEAYGVELQLRVGVNTGELLAGRVGGAYTVSGDAANVASRLQSASRPGAITVGAATMRATQHAIEYLPLEPLALKGKVERVEAWEAASALAEQPGGRAPARRALGPFVGREEELALIETLLRRVERDGRAQLVTIAGEAGVGKSRLLREVMQRLGRSDPAPAIRQGRCLPYGAGVVYWALGEVLREECGLVASDAPSEALAKLHRHVDALLAADGEDDAPTRARRSELIGHLLGIGAGQDGEADPEATREAAFGALKAVVGAMARERPLVLAFEDIHWADAGLLDLIEMLAQSVRAPVLLLCLTRDALFDHRPGWGSGITSAMTIQLEPLAAADTEVLVQAMLTVTAGSELAPMLAARSGGNPLFAEELVQRLLEEGSSDASDMPESVQALLAARLDALPAFERRLAQHAAVLGRAFPRSALEIVAREEGRDLDAALAELESRDLIVSEQGRPRGNESELAFRHVLIRDVAYATLPKAVRARKHAEVAEHLERSAGERAGELTPLLAEHLGRAVTLGEEARLPEAELAPLRGRALIVCEAAGEATAAVFSNAESLAQFGEALRFASTPDDRARIAERVGDIALRLGRLDPALEAWESALAIRTEPEDVARLNRKAGAGLWHRGDRTGAIGHYQTGINLLRDAPPSLELVHLYGDAASLYLERGDNMLAIYAAEKALRLAEQLGDARSAGRAHGIFGRVFGRMGDADQARASLERFVAAARELDDAETVRALTALGQHFENAEAAYGKARAAYEEALGLAERTGDVPVQVELRAAVARLDLLAGQWDGVRAAAEECTALAEREGLIAKLCLPQTLQAFVSWHEGDLAAAETGFAAAADGAEQVGWSEIAWAALLGLAVAQRDRGAAAVAAATLESANALCERAGLAVQQVQTASALALTLKLAGDEPAASAAAARTADLAAALPYPVAVAAAREAEGIAGTGGAAAIAHARDLWRELGRPLDATRCDALLEPGTVTAP